MLKTSEHYQRVVKTAFVELFSDKELCKVGFQHKLQ